MSKHETELRRRLAGDNVDIYETMSWFLTAIDAQAYVDGKPGEPDLSEFEREFLRANVERDDKARLDRMSPDDLFNKMATAKPDPNAPKVDMSELSDRQVIAAAFNGPYVDSATAELVKRANAKCVTVADFIRAALRAG
jgi:hypothetical protein